jgi:hypothetical protein
MNLTTKQLIFVVGIVDQMSDAARGDSKSKIEGEFTLTVEWQMAIGTGHPEGQYILKGVETGPAFR